jgi:hypothetical protein
MRYLASLIAITLANTLASAHATEAIAAVEGPTGVEVTPVLAPPELLSLRFEPEFKSIKYALFFTPGSARLGPKARRTVALMAPDARAADKIVIVGRADHSGERGKNVALGLQRARSLAAAMRAAGASRAHYELHADTAPVLVLPGDAHVVWMPETLPALMRRADVDIRTGSEDIAAPAEPTAPLVLRTSFVN